MTHTIAIIGCGTMGRAILEGLRSGAERDAFQVLASVRHADTAERLRRETGVRVTLSNAEAASAADVVLLGVKPQAVNEVLAEPALVAALEGKLLISICAGVRIERLEASAPGARVLRAMPNTPAIIQEGMTVLSPGSTVTEDDLALARRMFSSVGRCRILDEKHLDAVTGLSGSGPAFACVIIEALADGGVMMGLPREVAVELAAQTVQGAARLVLESGEHPAALRDRVTTPAGCTIAGLFMMEEGRVRSTLARTVQEATRVASGLGC